MYSASCGHQETETNRQLGTRHGRPEVMSPERERTRLNGKGCVDIIGYVLGASAPSTGLVERAGAPSTQFML